jgi:trehalose 6-phosphate phosphatase
MQPVLREVSARLSHALIALDFDGTLAPIVSDPSTSRPLPGAVEALSTLAAVGVQIAIVTGRDAHTVLGLGGLHDIPRLRVSGLHGAETWHEGQLETRDEPAGIAQLRGTLPALLAAEHPSIWLEDKRLSLVVHTRQAPDPDAALRSLEPDVRRLAGEQGLDVHPGKLVLEIRIPDLSKADAVELLLAEHTSAAIFAGDDLGDLPAFEAVRSWGERTGRPAVTISVGEVAEVCDAAQVPLATPAELTELLAELAATAGRG